MEALSKSEAFLFEDPDNPYLSGKYAPVGDERVDHHIEIIGELPDDLNGYFLRNSPNPRFEPKGKHHWFDGDGMIHALQFENGKATYRNRWIKTRGLQADLEAGEATYTGILEPPDLMRKGGPFKNTANTDLRYHGREVARILVAGRQGA